MRKTVLLVLVVLSAFTLMIAAGCSKTTAKGEAATGPQGEAFKAKISKDPTTGAVGTGGMPGPGSMKGEKMGGGGGGEKAGQAKSGGE